jgi:beta-lactamase regulating signal transducer with metallopeptidase domain
MTHILQAIAWTLIHFSWQATAIAIVYRLASLANARRSSQSRYLAALFAMLLMMSTSVVTFAWELDAAATTNTLSNMATEATGFIANSDLPHTMKPGIIGSHYEARTISLTSLLPWIDGLWVLGVTVLALRSLGGWMMLQRLRTSASTDVPADMEATFERICVALGLRRTVMLRVSSALAGPVTVGALRAMVLLPLSAVTSLGPDELEVVLAHELAHVRRADFFWNLVQTLAETLFFFHPAVWWIGGRIRHERELCCDDLALTVCPNPVVYASALFRLEQHRSRHWRMAMALDGHQSSQTLRMRIARILGEPISSNAGRRMQPFSLAAAVAALIVLLLPAPQVLAGLRPVHQVVDVRAAITKSLKTAVTAVPSAAVGQNPAAATPVPNPNPQAVAPETAPAVQEPEAELRSSDKSEDNASSKGSYIDRMKAAGYDVDLDKFIAMKIQNVTPEYARAMSQIGFGKLSADDLIACKIQGVSPEYIAELKQKGLAVESVRNAISFRIFQVTPEFVAGMKAAGFDGLGSEQLLAMRVQGVTPEYARSIKQQFPGATAEDLVKTRIFHIDADFIASAKKHGFGNLPLEKLVQLRISGLLDDESK